MKIINIEKTSENFNPVLDITFRFYDPLGVLCDIEHVLGTKEAEDEYYNILCVEFLEQYKEILTYIKRK